MIITPARFEDEMKSATSIADAIAAMLNTLDSMGYSAGTHAFFEKFIEHDLLNGADKK